MLQALTTKHLCSTQASMLQAPSTKLQFYKHQVLSFNATSIKLSCSKLQVLSFDAMHPQYVLERRTAEAFTLESEAKLGPGNYVRMCSTQLNARAVWRVFQLLSRECVPRSKRRECGVAGQRWTFSSGHNGCLIGVNVWRGLLQTFWADRCKLVLVDTSMPLSPVTSRGSEKSWISRREVANLYLQKSGNPSLKHLHYVGIEKAVVNLNWHQQMQPWWPGQRGIWRKKSFNLPISLTEKSATVMHVADFVSGFEGAAVVLLDSEITTLAKLVVFSALD